MDSISASSLTEVCPLLLEHLILSEIKNELNGNVITCAKEDQKYKNVRQEAKLEENFPEHIIGCKLLKDEKKIVTVTSRNILTIRNSTNLQVEQKIQCDYFATSICSLIIGESVNSLRVLFGSVIGDLIDWKPSEHVVPIQRKGHKGMIFSIVSDSSRIFTISDDRSIRMWSIDSRDSEPLYTAFGHTARPFSICVDEAQNSIYTGGIEQTLFFWKYDEHKIQLARKVVLSIGVIRKITQTDRSTLLISSQDGDVMKFNTVIEEDPQEVLLDSVLNFAHVKDFLAVLNESHELVVYETEAMENIVFRCSDIKNMNSCHESAVAWNQNVIVYLDGSHVYRVKLSQSIITAISYSTFVAVKIIDGFTHIYDFADPADVKLMTRFQQKSSFIPSAFLVMGNRILLGSTHGELESGPLNGGDVFHCLWFRETERVFGKKEVTCLETIPGTSCVMTLGKSGSWSTLKFNDPERPMGMLWNSQNFSASSRVAWPSKILRRNGDLLIVGFYGTSLIIWNASKAYPVIETYCGGGHREWQITESADPSVLHFDFIRDSQLVRQKIHLDAKQHLVSTPHSAPIVAAAGSLNYLVTVSLDGYISIADNFGKSLLNMFVGENLLCTDVFEDDNTVYVIAAGGKSKLTVWKFEKEDLERHSYRMFEFVHEDQCRIVSVKTVRSLDEIYFIATLSSGLVSILSPWKNSTRYDLLEPYFITLPDYAGIGTKLAYRESTKTLYIGTSASYLVSYEVSSCGVIEEPKRWKLADRSGVTALATREEDVIVGFDSGHVYRVDSEANAVLIHSHLSTVVGIVADETRVQSVSLDCAVLTSTGFGLSDLSRKPTIIDMPNGMVRSGKSSLVVVGDGIQIL